MRDLTMLAEQLRTIQRASSRFVRLWAMEQTFILPALDRMAADLSRIHRVKKIGKSRTSAGRPRRYGR